MKTLLFGLLAILFGIAAFVGGVGAGVGGFAYGIYLIILMAKGTYAATFGHVLLSVFCLLASGFIGWMIGMFFGFLSALCASIAKDE